LYMANLDSPSLKDALEKGIELKSVFEKQSTSSDIEPLEKLQVLWGEKNKKPILANFKSYFKEAGLRDLERETTYAIEYGKTDSAPLFVKWVKFIFFELTSGYGLHYIRPLIILFSLIGVFTIVYIFPLIGIGKNGIYRMWSKDRVKKDKVIEERERLIYRIWLKNRFIKTRTNIFKAIGYAFYFSMLSSFHIGWRDLNVGSWIARIQPREYNLKATGWVRTVSGIQSLISIYLLALWVLTQFGRPFE